MNIFSIVPLAGAALGLQALRGTTSEIIAIVMLVSIITLLLAIVVTLIKDHWG